MIDKERLRRMAALYDIDLDGPALEKFDIYAALLTDYNRKVNLTAITDAREIEEKHFLDSLIFAKNPLVKGSLADVGSGAGFPGVAALILKPELKLTLIEPTGKRCEFLKYLAGRLNLEYMVLKERAEEAAPKGYREVFDTVTARAVACLPVLAEYCLPLVKPGGYFIAMKGREGEKEANEAASAAEKLGGELSDILNFTLPSAGGRSLIIYKKVRPTPKAYPRNGGKIKKKPL